MTLIGRPGRRMRRDLEFVDDRFVHRLVLGLKPRAARRQPVRAEALEEIVDRDTAPTLQFRRGARPIAESR